jgi:hypothetical protein
MPFVTMPLRHCQAGRVSIGRYSRFMLN